MHPIEVRSALDGMVCLVDTREQDTPRFRKRLEQMGVPWERRKLDFGDYSAYFPLPGGGCLDLSNQSVVERKMSLDELCNCYCKDRPRFTREFERARKSGAKVYLLVENGSWEKAYSGTYRSRMRPEALVASITAWLARYSCQLLFCEPDTSGRLIREVLYRDGKERLEALVNE